MRQTGPIVSWVADYLHTNLKHEVEVERAEGRGCLTRSVKLARLVRCFSCLGAEPVTIALTSDRQSNASTTPVRLGPRTSDFARRLVARNIKHAKNYPNVVVR